MITLRMTAEVKDDRRIVLTLPPEVPTGRAELVVTVESPNGTSAQPRGVPAEAVHGIGQRILRLEPTGYPDEQIGDESAYEPIEFPLGDVVKARFVADGCLSPPSYPETAA